MQTDCVILGGGNDGPCLCPPYGERRQGPFVERSAHLDDCLLSEEATVSGFARNMTAATLVGYDEIGASTRPGPDLWDGSAYQLVEELA